MSEYIKRHQEIDYVFCSTSIQRLLQSLSEHYLYVRKYYIQELRKTINKFHLFNLMLKYLNFRNKMQSNLIHFDFQKHFHF